MGHSYPQRGRTTVSGGNVRRDVSRRLHAGQLVPDGVDDLYRICG